jgi:hypothetical protein
MALFFDAAWFEARLSERGLGRAALAAGAGLSEADLALLFKDQRELSAAEVTAFAELLGVSPPKSPTTPGSRRRFLAVTRPITAWPASRRG